MLAPEMTLAAALRDAAHGDAAVRAAGVRNLAPALLAALGRPGPAYCDDADHVDVAAACARLSTALDDGVVEIAGQAAIGLGALGRAEVLERAAVWVAIDRADDDTRWLHQTAIIATSYVGVAARGRDAALHSRVIERLRAAWRSPHDDVRFQVALARVEVDDPDAEHDIVAALADEDSAEVRDQLVAALALLPRLEPASLEALAVLLRSEHALGDAGMTAATTLAAHGRAESVARLVTAVGRRHERDTALEALGDLGPAAAAAIAPAEGVLRRWWNPPITRVRAAYALARIAPAGSQAHARALRALGRWAYHPRAAVREAVADARRALDGPRSPPP